MNDGKADNKEVNCFELAKNLDRAIKKNTEIMKTYTNTVKGYTKFADQNTSE